MPETMTSRQRMLAAINNQKPDRVPVAPDISYMVPTRLTGKGFYSVFIDSEPPLWRAYIDAVKYYGMDGWFTYGWLGYQTRDVTRSEKWILWTDARRVQEVTWHTPAGDLTEEFLYVPDMPPTYIKKMIVDLDRDWPRFKYILGEIESCDLSGIEVMRQELGELGVFGCCLATPGFHIWNNWFQGNVNALCQVLITRPEIFDELLELHDRRLMEELEWLLRCNPDLILTGGSGGLQLASPDLWMKYALPNLKKQCRVCKERGVPTMVHSCGRQKFMIEVCARETDLNCLNPLEIPPMGDCTLAEAKAMVCGSNLTLMGNLHTTEVMLRGTVEQVKAAARQAIDDAGAGGGFILSTGDQCGRDTPDENIFAMVEVAKTYGRYD